MNVAVIDVGSNTVRLLVAGASSDGFARSGGEGGPRARRGGRAARADLEPEAAETARWAESFARMARKAGASHVEMIVTAPGRQSENGDELVALLLEASGAGVRVLSPDEEGRLAFQGAVQEIATDGETVAVCDVGGGSTEVVVGTRTGEPAWLRSVDIGALRLTRRVLDEDPPTPRRSSSPVSNRARVRPLTPPLPKIALAAGGTARALRKLVGDTLGADELARPSSSWRAARHADREDIRHRPGAGAHARCRRSDPRGGTAAAERPVSGLARWPSRRRGARHARRGCRGRLAQACGRIVTNVRSAPARRRGCELRPSSSARREAPRRRRRACRGRGRGPRPRRQAPGRFAARALPQLQPLFDIEPTLHGERQKGLMQRT